MSKKSVITLPDGTVIEISPDLSPEQITAMITALTQPVNRSISDSPINNKKTGKTYIHKRTPQEIWQSSRRERVALFIRAYMSEELWFNAKDIMDQQLAITGKLTLGETAAISTYLARLFETGYLDRKKSGGRSVFYRMTDKLIAEYPYIETEQLTNLIENYM